MVLISQQLAATVPAALAMASSTTNPMWVELCSQLAPIASIMVFCAPIRK
jgi:hypothetical protein